MRKIVLFIASSLDGFIAGSDDDHDWMFTGDKYGFGDFLAEVDTTLMGYRMFGVLSELEEFPYKEQKNYVFTRLEGRRGTPYTEFVYEDTVEFTKRLRQKEGGPIWLMGSGEIIRDLHNADLIDEYRIFIHPVVLGSGAPLFADGSETRTLAFLSSHNHEDGLTELRYKKKEA